MYYLGTNDRITLILNDQVDNVKMRHEGGPLSGKSRGYKTIKVLKANEGVLEKPCLHCGSIINTTYREPTKSELIRDNVCFFCNFWMGYIEKKNNLSIARIDGNHYIISPDGPAGFKGFGGRKFTIIFNDGREITSHNLWHQGTIPDHFKKQLPDNAKFI